MEQKVSAKFIQICSVIGDMAIRKRRNFILSIHIYIENKFNKSK